MQKEKLKFLNNGFVIALLALLSGAAAMAVLFAFFDTIWKDEPALEETAPPAETNSSPPIVEGDVHTLNVRSVPAPFTDPEEGTILGYVFIDVALDVMGGEARESANRQLEGMVRAFAGEMRGQGIARAGQPGVVDYARLERIFREIAEDRLGETQVREVRISPSEDA